MGREKRSMPEPFIPGERAWVLSHYYDVPNETAEFCGTLADANVLNVGCGEMLSDFGLLNCNVAHITGLDTQLPFHWPSSDNANFLDTVAAKLRTHGIDPRADYASRLSHQLYDGHRFPFEDRTFDFIFSWSAFEHVSNVPQIISEIRRVLTDDGRAFIQVYPWYHCFVGSHLSDYIQEPYFHLKRDFAWVRQEMKRYGAEHPADQHPFLNYMLSEYQSLNRYSANHFYKDVIGAGFNVVKARMISFDLDLSGTPEETEFSSLMICGTKMLLKKNFSFVPGPAAEQPIPKDELLRKQLAEIHRSLSWRVTAPLRSVGGLFLKAFRPRR